jgi:hypothetical protein
MEKKGKQQEAERIASIAKCQVQLLRIAITTLVQSTGTKKTKSQIKHRVAKGSERNEAHEPVLGQPKLLLVIFMIKLVTRS